MWDLKIKEGQGTKHDALVEYISKLIDEGKLKPGEMLPTQRDISTRMKVSIGTVIKAFTELEKRGYVAGEVGRGTFVSDYKYLSSNEASDYINLGNFESPDFTTIPSFRALQSGINEVTRESELYFKMGYRNPSGSHEHKISVLRWLKQGKVEGDVNNVLICGGAHHAIFISVQVLTRPGDYLMVEELGTLNIRDICTLLGLKVLPLKMDQDGIIPKHFEEACKSGKSKVLYTIPTLQNPTCIVMSVKRRKELVKIAEKYSITIVEDAVNDLLLDAPVSPIHTFYSKNTIYVSSLSKTISPGVRIGMIITHDHNLLEKLDFASRATIWMNSPLLNEIAANLITSGKGKIMLDGKKQAIKQRQAIFKKFLGNYNYVTHPNAFHVWLELPDYWTSEDFTNEIITRKVMIRSSGMFYVGQNGPPNFVRIGLGSPHTTDELKDGLEKILALMNERPTKPGGF